MIAFLGFPLMGVIAADVPHSGRGPALEGNGAIELN
jgi:hypothetical protein